MTPLSFLQPRRRPEFDRVINDVETLKTGHAELRILMDIQGKEQHRQSEMLADIKRGLEDERRTRKQCEARQQADRERRDHAMKRTVWAASALGPALLTTLWHLILHGH